MNHVRILVQSVNLTNLGPLNGKTYGWQSAAIFNGGDFPMPFQVCVQESSPYKPGEYTLDPRSFQRDDRGNLRLKGVKLLPLGGAGK